MTEGNVRARIRAAAHEAIARGEPLAWYEAVYQAAAGETGAVPWADLVPNPSLVSWLDGLAEPAESPGSERRERREPNPLASRVGPGCRVLVVGCGLGDDAELLASRGAQVVAFDIAPNAIAWCQSRFPGSGVAYVAADLLAPSDAWISAFDFVFEAYTLQAMAPSLRAQATSVVPRFVAPGGTLLVVARGAEQPPALEDGPPWPLVRAEVEAVGADLALASWEDYVDAEGERRFRATFSAPAAT